MSTCRTKCASDAATMVLSIALLCAIQALPTSRARSLVVDYYDDYADDIPETPAAVATHNITDFQNYLVKFLDGYYEKYVRPHLNTTAPKSPVDIYEQMQSDQPVTQNVNLQIHNGTDYSALKRG